MSPAQPADPAFPELDVEGVEDSSNDGWDDYPLDAVFVRTELRTASEVVKRIEGKRYILDPDFQRDFVWNTQKQSKLIESCVMRIPLPVFYVAEAPDGRIIVVDGLQRLTTFSRFIGGHFRISGLTKGGAGAAFHPLEGKYFSELPLSLQERVLDTQLTMYILDAKAPERARLDIFERVNSGEPLTRQQMRNALYNGPATLWLKHAAESDAFRSATGQTLDTKKMRDREAINRFCAFGLLGVESYRSGDMDAFLAAGLKKLANLSAAQRESLAEKFERSMRLNRELFGDHAFRKSLASNDKQPQRSPINISLFEVCAVCMSEIENPSLEKKELIRNRIIDLVRDQQFAKAITYSTNSTVAVHDRFYALQYAIQGD